ncbi:E4 ORF 6/7 [Baboon adenovirus 3]|uniref:E4 ORF 6/7 n=1 Tax=Simian mastadenovirus C TaxID=1962300 RepID=M9YZ28_9ADEN|nr:E4 ORF 6/7 [Baboon adenovirus 3]AGK27154.1 E4 ORF 6/7 [Baboon adenovirus 3]AGK27226.1 E4 ORF 6/7 [Simian mastadenovirus C]
MQRDRRYRCRLGPYNRHQLPPCDETPCATIENPPYLECENLNMHNVSEGFVSVTDERFARKETVWTLTPKNPCLNTQFQLFTATKGERMVYSVKWKGGGSLTVRIM